MADRLLSVDSETLLPPAPVLAALSDEIGGTIAQTVDDLTDVTITSPTSGQVLKYNGTAWTNQADATGGGGGAVDSVNGATGVVVLDADDISDTSATNKWATAAEKTKLAGIATAATANDTDAALRDRGTHTGSQTASTISDFSAAADARVSAGITSAIGTTVQARDADLDAISALTPTNNDVLQRKSGSWTNRTPAQLKTDLAYTINEVVPTQTDQGGKVLGTDGTTTTWTTLPATPPTVATVVYDAADDPRPGGADIVFWVPADPALADPSNATVDDIVLRSNTVEALTYALSDETTVLTTGVAKLTVRAPWAFTLTGVRASLTTASSSGVVTVDINEGGTTVMATTKLTIDQGERTSVTAAAPAVISDSAIADDAELTFDVDTAGASAVGLKVTLFARRV